MKSFTYTKESWKNPADALSLEWLETNGLGGWASSTILGANSRRYHGLLVAATKPPVGRVVMVSKLDETIISGDQRFELSVNQFPGVYYPQGFQYLEKFEKEYFPTWNYRVGDCLIKKSITAIYFQNTVVVTYELLSKNAVDMELRPFLAARDYHHINRKDNSIRMDGRFENGIFEIQPRPSLPVVYFQVLGSQFTAQPDWFYNFEYAIEKERGLEFQEDLFTPGIFSVKLEFGKPLSVIISTDNLSRQDGSQLVKNELVRRKKLVNPKSSEAFQQLTLAADQFIVKRGGDLRTVIAGYPWFTDWGRDTMIALPGLTLATGRFDDAKKILLSFSEHVSRGMLPNRFPEGDETPDYNTVDATLWYFVAIYKYWQRSADFELVKRLLPILEDIIVWHERGTRYGIKVDADGLLYAGEKGIQLTWMDAKIGDWVVTPREGKCVEINALWYNALKILEAICTKKNDTRSATKYAEKSARVAKRFNELFPSEKGLYDCLHGDHKDSPTRPNQVFALSLPFPIVDKILGKKILNQVTEKLFTPVGLRSLSPDDSNYRPIFTGDPRSRDSAYHQGTVWGWLIGPFIDAMFYVHGAKAKPEAVKIVKEAARHLSVACIGQYSEVFNAESPHVAKGACAQAWSVAEILRVMDEYNL